MSDRRNILFIEPKPFSYTAIEEFHFIGIRCPICDGGGKVPIHADYFGMKPDDLEDCQRCGGSGKLKADVVVNWSGDK